jgi:PAS domain S-box-containing protein
MAQDDEQHRRNDQTNGLQAADPDAIASGDGSYRVLANALPQIIWTCDAEGRLEWINDRWTELTGLDLEWSLRDKNALDAVHPEDRPVVAQRFAEAYAARCSYGFEYRIRTRDGEYRYHLARVAPLRDGDGMVTRWVAAAFDIHERHETEDALRASERRFEAVFQLNPQPMTITRISDGTFLHTNDAFVRLSGFSREEIVGSNPIALGIWSKEQRAAIVQTLREARGAIAVECRRKDGVICTMQMASALVTIGGEPCMIAVGVDITDQVASDSLVRDSEARARARADELAVLMDALPAVVLMASDAECNHVRANRAGREMLRTGADQNLSKTSGDPGPTRHFRVFVDNEEVPSHDLPLQRAARGIEVRNHEELIAFDDGDVVHLYGSAVPLRDGAGRPRGAVGAFVDVTRLKQAEAALRDADRRKDEFLALLSHELRNPLAPIVTAAQLMQRNGDVAMPMEREIILRQSKHLARLVDDLLDVSRVARGLVTLTRRPLELAMVVTKAVESVAPLLEDRRHRLEVTVPAHGLQVEGDEVRLTQVVSNLLTNAARYTPLGGRIEIVAAREGGEMVLRVRDNGIGIDGSLLPHVFEMFMQGAAGIERSQGGLGLGLSLVHTLVALHGGSVTAHSDGRGRGSEFVVRLPASTAAPVGRVEPARPSWPASRRWRVLLVDDNRDAAALIGNLLRRAGHDMQIAHDPSIALEMIVPFRPQVAILDIGLPVMDGYALADAMRHVLGDATPVLIAVTGYGQERDRQKSEQSGFRAHFVKPVDSETMLALLDTLTPSEE